jgi:predicted ester cyclase
MDVRELMKLEVDPAEVRSVYELWKQHSIAEDERDLPGLISTLTEDCVYELVQTGDRWEGHDGAARFYTQLLTAFPDIKFELTNIVIGPQGVCEEADVRAMHRGPWLGVEPTGDAFNSIVLDDVNGICVDSVRWGEAGSGIPAFDPDFDQLTAAIERLAELDERERLAAGAPIRQTSLWKDAVYRFTRNRAAVVAVIVFTIIVLYCLVVPFVSPHDPNEVDFSQAYAGFSLDHPFSTDKFGRDLFARAAVGLGEAEPLGLDVAEAVVTQDAAAAGVQDSTA